MMKLKRTHNHEITFENHNQIILIRASRRMWDTRNLHGRKRGAYLFDILGFVDGRVNDGI
jgi:hypothetical protein